MTERFSRDVIITSSPDDPRARPLLEDLIREYDGRYGHLHDYEGAAVELARYPVQSFAPPHGNFLLLLRDGETVGGGAFMRYDGQTAEFKRIWTRTDLRRQGLARVILSALEEQAAVQGYRRIYLTTGFRQPEAQNLYLTTGYTALYGPDDDLEARRILPFEKYLPAAGIPAAHP